MTKKTSYEELEQRVKALEKEVSNLMRNEEALRLSNERILKIFHKSPDAISLTLVADGTFIDVNETFEKMFGIPRKSAIGQTSLKLGLWPDAKARENLIARIRADGFVYNMELKHRRASGEIFNASLSAELIEIDGRPCILAYIRDISNRKWMEEKLRESEKKYQSLFNNAQVALFRTSTDGKLIEINKRYAEMAGYSNVEDCMAEFNPGKAWCDPNGRIDFLKIVQKKGFVNDYETKIIRRDGSSIWILFSAMIFPDQDFIEGSIVEITDRKQTEDALRESKKKFKHIFESANVGKSVTSLTGEIGVNKAFCDLLGYTPDELRGKTWQELTPPDEIDGVQNILNSLIKGEKDSVRFDKRFFHKNGSFIWADVSVAMHRDSEGKPVHFITTVVDMTYRKHAEAEKERMAAKLNHAQKMESIGNLAGGIAHDFNNILSSIIGFTELAMDDVEKDSLIEDHLQEVYTAGKRAKDLVRQILAFARQSEEKVGPIQVDLIVTEVLKFIRASIPATVEIRKNINSNSSIVGNPSQLYQIMMNLCTNAAHAMEAGGGILDVSLKDIVIDRHSSHNKLNLTCGNYIGIFVSDTGSGIAPDIIDSIFEPYFTTKEIGEGTGMGLATVHGIVESYGGKIDVESTLRKGTTFTIYLPVTRKCEIRHQYKSEILPTGAEHILFVDDEAQLAKMGSRMLKRAGYKVATKTSSVEALELFRSKPDDFDLIITDMTMPHMTGVRLATELMKIRPEIPVILCTGYSKKIMDERADEIGIKAFVYKPIVRAELTKTVRKVLDAANNDQEQFS